MKLSVINRTHIIEAGDIIDHEGIPNDSLYNNYWVELPNGKEYPFKYLTRTAYKIAAEDEQQLDFQSNESYRGYIEGLKFPINYYKEGYNFFTVDDIEHFEEIGGEKYRKADEENLREAQLLKLLVHKVNKWAEGSLVEDFQSREDYHWQWSGTFKPYLWIRLFRPRSSKKVFFVLGASSDGVLYYHLDCLRSNYTKEGVLPIAIQNRFDAYLGKTDCTNVIIRKDQFHNYDWDRLIEETTRYIYKYASLYDELENLVNSPDISTKLIDRFVEEEPPAKTKTYLDRKRTFKGRIIDWSQKQATSKLLGDSGEKLVIEFEKLKLKKAGLLEKEKLVTPVLDGMGYDLLSFDKDGNEIHIEVKTTTGGKDEPFYFSINEKEYIEQHRDNYFLYRLYEFRVDPDRTKYFILSAKELLDKAQFNATNFEVSLND